jgi:hypothetical protein
VPYSSGGTNELSNLHTLCKDCHEAVHHNGKKAPTGNNTKTGNNTATEEAPKLGKISSLFVFIGATSVMMTCYLAFFALILPVSVSSSSVATIVIIVSIIGVFFLRQGYFED